METAQVTTNHPDIDITKACKVANNFSQNKFIVLTDFVNPDFVKENFLPEISRCDQFIHRVKVGSFKKSGSVGSDIIQKMAPSLYALYHSDLMKSFIENLVGEKLQVCPDSDLHSVALYYYTEAGDHIGVHYDKSFYRGRRYTVLLGMIQDSIHSNLVCYPGSNKLNRKKNPLTVYTDPGTLVVFDGDALWHEVTPLGEGEKRVILTMEYVTDPTMSRCNQIVSTFKDRFLYFGKNKA